MALFIVIVIVLLIVWFVRSAKPKSTLTVEARQMLGRNPLRTIDFPLTIYQALESMYIIDNSSNIATVKSRLIFLHDLLASCEFMINVNITSYQSFWPGYLDRGIGMYERMYFDRPVSQEVKDILLQPTALLENWGAFTQNMLLSAAKKYIDAQEVIIAALKADKSIRNRYIKLADYLQGVYEDLSNAELKEECKELQMKILVNAY